MSHWLFGHAAYFDENDATCRTAYAEWHRIRCERDCTPANLHCCLRTVTNARWLYFTAPLCADVNIVFLCADRYHHSHSQQKSLSLFFSWWSVIGRISLDVGTRTVPACKGCNNLNRVNHSRYLAR